MRLLEDINFNMLSLTLLFKRYVIAIFDMKNVLKEVCILRYLDKNVTNSIFQNKAVLLIKLLELS